MSALKIELVAGCLYAKIQNNTIASSMSMEALLLYQILQRLPDPNAPLPEAVEWETEDGTMRTTDKAMARNWAPHMNVRVVRRATS